MSANVGTSFEQYRDLKVSLGLNASYDDLRTNNEASSALKKQSGEFSELATNYGFTFDQRNRAFMPTSGSIISLDKLPICGKSFISNTFSASGYKTITEEIVGATKVVVSY